MENTLLDRQTLEQAADALLAQKYPGQPVETLTNERENVIAMLDDSIGQSIIDKLTPEQLDTYLNLLNTEQNDSSVFENFFRDNQIDLKQTAEEATKQFAINYLGGENV
jgi:hypothetical protein